MKNKQLFSQINYSLCLKGLDHQDQPLSRVCIDTNCKQKQLICAICEQSDHKDHTTIPLKHFLKIIVKQSDLATNQANLLFYVSQFQKLKKQTILLLKLKRKLIDKKFEDLQQTVSTYFNSFDDIFKKLLHAKNPVQQIINQLIYGVDIDAKKLTQKFKQILTIISLDEDTTFSLKSKLQGLVDLAKNKQYKLSFQISEVQAGLIKKIQTINTLFSQKISLTEKQTQFFWSNNLKGAKIKVNQLLAEQTGMQSNGQRFILMEPNLGIGKKKNWGIKIKKFGGWIGIGISLQKLIKTANYNFNYTVMGHGSYLISTNGYSWSHSVKQFNSAFKSFQFSVNDVIYLQFDPIVNKIRFRKNDSNQLKDKFELDILPTPLGDFYHPSANLCSLNDIVQIIYPGKSLS